MNPPRRERPERPLSDEYFADDGVDPRTYFSNQKKKENHTKERLRKTVEDLASLILAFEIEDPILEGLEIVRTSCIRGGKGIEVAVVAPQDTTSEEALFIREKLPHVARMIRAEVAQSLQRRRALEIVVRLQPTRENRDD